MHPWKAQKIRAPVSGGIPGRCRYADLSKPLPDPPAGRTWVQDVFTREWILSESAVVGDGDDGAAVATLDGAAPVDAAIVLVEREAGDDDVDLSEPLIAAESNAETPAVAMAVAVAVEAVAAVPVLILSDDAVKNEPLSSSDGATSSSIVYHDVKPTDTFQGLCLRYGVTAAALRRANGILMGTDLRFAPEQLVIPATKNGSRRGVEKEQRTGDQKVVEFVDHFAHRKRVLSIGRNVLRGAPVYDGNTTGGSRLGSSEARAYLEMNDWDVDRAIRDAEGDLRWDLESDGKVDPPAVAVAVAVAAGTEIEMSATTRSSKKYV